MVRSLRSCRSDGRAEETTAIGFVVALDGRWITGPGDCSGTVVGVTRCGCCAKNGLRLSQSQEQESGLHDEQSKGFVRGMRRPKDGYP